METSEDELILTLRTMQSNGNDSNLRQECAPFLENYKPIARKALWAYNHFLGKSQQNISVNSASFIEQHLNGWCDFFLNAAKKNENQSDGNPIKGFKRKLIVGWHCPEYPLWLNYANEDKVLVLVARQVLWMEEKLAKENFYCFRNLKLSSKLPRAFRENRPIFAMMDYCYDGTAYIISNFLGYPAKTPVGLIKLAQRYDYEIVILTTRNQTCVVKESFPANSFELQQTLDLINKSIESEILSNPQRWLLWASIDRRWIGVEYG